MQNDDHTPAVPTSVGDGGARGTREQWRDNYRTPPGVLAVVRRLIGTIHVDAAALLDVSVGLGYIGPDHASQQFRDALTADWLMAARCAVHAEVYEACDLGAVLDGPQLTAFQNPPYSEIAKHAEACARWGSEMTVALLCYERRETAWWRDHIQPNAAEVHTLYPRVRHIDPRDGSQSGSPNLHSCIAVFRPGVSGPPMSRHANWRES